MQVKVQPALLRWAFIRAGYNEQKATERFPGLGAWLAGEKDPTLKQLEQYAKRTHAALGYFFRDTPPQETMPIPDLRTVGDKEVRRPSVDLLDTIYLCQRRQEWYRDYALANDQEPLPFVGAATVRNDVEKVAGEMRHTLRLDLAERASFKTWEEARRRFTERAEDIGVLVLTSGIVGCNTNRSLNTDEFRGFALSDTIAPLVFINGKDSQSAQMFTLAHELAHIWLGQSAVTDQGPVTEAGDTNSIEQWCNAVAAELLVPRSVLLSAVRANVDARSEAKRLTGIFKVSSLVILRRLHDVGSVSRAEMWNAYESELAEIAIKRELGKDRGGGSMYNNLRIGVGSRFAKAIVADTLGGSTLHQQALRLLGLSSVSSFNGFARNLGLM